MKKTQLHDDPERTNYIGMARYAVDFFKVALAAEDTLGTEKGCETLVSIPIMFLVGQSIELILKSYLLYKEVSLKELRTKYGHGLIICLDKAKELGVTDIVALTQDDINNIKIIDDLYSSKQLQYIVTGGKTFPDFSPLERVTRKLLISIGQEVGFSPRGIGKKSIGSDSIDTAFFLK